MSGSEMFYKENGKKEDAKAHEQILSDGFNDKNEHIARAVRLGLNEYEISVLYP